MATAPAAAPRIEQGTALAEDEARAATWREQIAASDVDPALWTGAFATNVWGGRYEIDGLLGAGGQGTTFAGTDRKTGARVAVKVLDLKHAADWKRVELFEREVAALQTVEHEGMPAFVDVLEDEQSGARALVMTLVQGESFHDVLQRRGPLKEAALWRVLVDVSDVLRALHSEDVPMVHRDIKPRNLVRRADGRICVVDFGGVGTRGSKGSTVVGTFGYMAPEQLYGKSSAATDIYSLGATILALATGDEPEDMPRDGLAIDIDKAAAHLSDPLRDLLKRMVAPEPKDRPADARALAAQLNELYDRSKQGDRASGDRWEDDSSGESDGDSGGLSAGDRDDLEEAANVIAGIVQLFIGVLGTVATVAIGEVLLPIIFMVAQGFVSKDGRARITAAKSAVDTASKVARQGFTEAARRGQRTLQGSGGRKKRLRNPPGAKKQPPPRAPRRRRVRRKKRKGS